MANSVPILLYHRIDCSGEPHATSPAAFRRHLQWLKERGWRSLDREEFSTCLRSGRAFPAHSFVITFDDGYESVASAAFASLQEFRYRALCFLSTRFLRGARQARADAPPEKDGKLFLSWEQVRALQSCGVVDFQSHTHAHQRFSDLTPEALVADLDLSRQLLASELALPSHCFEHLAWPWGRADPASRALARQAGFKYQYTVARLSYQWHGPLDEIPRTCFDAAAFTQFQRQFRLQSGCLSRMWNLAYPFGRRVRQLSGL
jgi:peptidoglycan/xylan/chitin deacetylase (PgdA/CDA1 family)